jgi:hypothetical protein
MQTNKTVARIVVAVVSDPAKLFPMSVLPLCERYLETIHLQHCLLLRLALRYAMFYERTQHVFLYLPLRSISARDYLLCMSKIMSNVTSAKLDTSMARLASIKHRSQSCPPW